MEKVAGEAFEVCINPLLLTGFSEGLGDGEKTGYQGQGTKIRGVFFSFLF